MTLNIAYGKQLQSNFLDAGEAIARDVQDGKFLEVSKKLNTAFFAGGVLAPKSFASLTSINIPRNPTHIAHELDGHSYIAIRKEISFSAVVGFIEGIPGIGSAIAAINTLYHLFGMLSSYAALKKAVKVLNTIERNEYNVGRGASCNYTEHVFAAAINYTVHQNHLIGSLLSLLPLVKPITRITQGIIFNRTDNGIPRLENTV